MSDTIVLDKSFAVRLHEWHDSQSDPIYMVGSTCGYPTDLDLVNRAIANLHEMRGQVAEYSDDEVVLLRLIVDLQSEVGIE